MTDNHSYSFFGQKVGLIIQSSAKTDPYMFFRLIRSKNDGSWEKPSSGEGKVIKFSLEEMIHIIQVLKKEVDSWSSYHTFKDTKTQIAFKWENGEKKKLWIHIDKYSKMLDYAQFTILEMFMSHILTEKIEFATTLSTKENNGTYIVETREGISKNTKDTLKVIKISGIIKGVSSKALLIEFPNEQEVWIPKSTISSNYIEDQKDSQSFNIQTWILEKNKITI